VDKAWQDLMQFQIERARDMMQRGAPLGSILGGRIGLEMRLIIAGGNRILNKIQNVNYDIFQHRPVLRPHDWLIMLLKSAPFNF
jgi:phytoene synthase